MKQTRREFIHSMGRAGFGLGLAGFMPQDLLAMGKPVDPFTFEISLAEFSFASELYTGKMTNLDFPKRAVNEFGITALEYVSGFFNDKHTDQAYLKELKMICDDLGAINHLIMVDGANLAALDDGKRQEAVESYDPWLDAAKFLGCSSIRVNLGDAMAVLSGQGEEGSAEDMANAAVDGYGKLLEVAGTYDLNIIVENHFGHSTNPDWLISVMDRIESDKKGFLPDFGNFCAKRSKPETYDLAGFMKTSCLEEHDKYEGVKKMMPLAKGISAKTHRFGPDGMDLETDFMKMFQIIKDSGWSGGYVGVEYEGGLMRDMGGDQSFLSNAEGVKATKKLLEKIRKKMK